MLTCELAPFAVLAEHRIDYLEPSVGQQPVDRASLLRPGAAPIRGQAGALHRGGDRQDQTPAVEPVRLPPAAVDRPVEGAPFEGEGLGRSDLQPIIELDEPAAERRPRLEARLASPAAMR